MDELLALLRSRSLQHGDFQLRSGERSNWYVDGKKTTFSAGGALAVGHAFLAECERVGADAVGGLTIGADPIAIATAVVSALENRPVTPFSVRAVPKDHGVGGRVVGPLEQSHRVLLVEDVTTTGGALLEALDAVREVGCEVMGAVALLARGDRPAIALAAQGVTLRSLYTAEDFVQ
jgi:orotate phosphoribosyltransferase